MNPVKAVQTSEPAVAIGFAISAGLALLWTILSQAGVEITQELKDGVEAFIYALMAVPAIAGFIIRFAVVPTDKAQAKIDQAYVADPGSDPKPTLT